MSFSRSHDISQSLSSFPRHELTSFLSCMDDENTRRQIWNIILFILFYITRLLIPILFQDSGADLGEGRRGFLKYSNNKHKTRLKLFLSATSLPKKSPGSALGLAHILQAKRLEVIEKCLQKGEVNAFKITSSLLISLYISN